MTKEALKLALEAMILNNAEWKRLADSGDGGDWSAEEQDHYKQTEQAITAIKEALAQPEQEPVAWMHPDGRIWTFGQGFDKSTFTIPLYTSPPASKPLTHEEIEALWDSTLSEDVGITALRKIARAIEAAHQIKGEA